MNALYGLLKENVELYNNFLDLEYKKYDAVLKADICTLDVIVSEEQAYYLKMRGLEQKREKIVEELGVGNKTLTEIIELCDNEQKLQLTEIYNKLHELIKEVKKINNLCKTLIEVRLLRVDNAISKLGKKENTYTNGDIKNNNSINLIISKRI